MTVSEVAIALEQYTNDRRTRDPSYQPNLLVSKTIEYTNTISTNKNLDTVRKIRNLLAEAGMTETELALVVCVGYRVMCPVRDSLVCSDLARLLTTRTALFVRAYRRIWRCRPPRRPSSSSPAWPTGSLTTRSTGYCSRSKTTPSLSDR